MPRAQAAVGTAVNCVRSSQHAESWKGIQVCREEHGSQGSVPFLALPLTLSQHLEQDTSLQGNKSGFRGAAGSEAELIRAQTNMWSAMDGQRYTAQRASFSNSEELEAGGLNESPGSSGAKHRLELQVQGWRGWAKPRKQPWRCAGQAAAQKHPQPGLQEAEEPGTLLSRQAVPQHTHPTESCLLVPPAPQGEGTAMHPTRTAPATPCLPGADSNRDTQREAPGQGREHQQCTASKQLSPSLGKDGCGPRAAGP